MRDKLFFINSIKMDLHRVVTAVGDTNKNVPQQSVIEFMKHADKDFEKIELNEKELLLRQQLLSLLNHMPDFTDNPAKLKWAEDVLTIRCRL